MAEGQASSRFDRVGKPDPTVSRTRDQSGKEALYSTAPSAAPSSQVLVSCRRCGVSSAMSVVGSLRLLKPPVLYDPLSHRLWSRCPACERRSWLEIRQGQVLRAVFPGR